MADEIVTTAVVAPVAPVLSQADQEASSRSIKAKYEYMANMNRKEAGQVTISRGPNGETMECIGNPLDGIVTNPMTGIGLGDLDEWLISQGHKSVAEGVTQPSGNTPGKQYTQKMNIEDITNQLNVAPAYTAPEPEVYKAPKKKVNIDDLFI